MCRVPGRILRGALGVHVRVGQNLLAFSKWGKKRQRTGSKVCRASHQIHCLYTLFLPLSFYNTLPLQQTSTKSGTNSSMAESIVTE